MSSSTPRIHPYLGLALGVLAVAAAAIIVRLAQQIQVPSFVIAAYRLTFASLILAPLALTRYRVELATLKKSDYAWAGVTGLCLGLHFATWFTSLEYTTVASSAVFVTTAPLFVAIFSAVVWRERLGWVVSLGLISAIVGGGLIGVADVCRLGAAGLTYPALGDFVQGRAFIGDGLATLGAIGFAAYMLIGRRLRAKLSLIPYIFLAYSAAALTLIVIVILAGQSFVGYSPAAYFWLGLLAPGAPTHGSLGL